MVTDLDDNAGSERLIAFIRETADARDVDRLCKWVTRDVRERGYITGRLVKAL